MMVNTTRREYCRLKLGVFFAFIIMAESHQKSRPITLATHYAIKKVFIASGHLSAFGNDPQGAYVGQLMPQYL
jgi:hypothetical protein